MAAPAAAPPVAASSFAPASVPANAACRFVRGPGVSGVIEALSRAGSNVQRFDYCRLEAWAEKGGAALPNPYSLVLLPKPEHGEGKWPPAARYLTLSSQGGVTLWDDRDIVECYPLDEWRHAHASFARVASAAVLCRFRARYTFWQWRNGVMAQRNARHRAALLRARREPQNQSEASHADALVGEAFAAPMVVVHRMCGFIRAQALEPAQLGETSSASAEAELPPVELGAANGAAIAHAVAEQLTRATLMLRSAMEALLETLQQEDAQPLATVPEMGCRFLLEKYSPRLYSSMAQKAFNQPARLESLRSTGQRVTAVHRMAPSQPVHGADLRKLDRWIVEAAPSDLRRTAESLEARHLLVAAACVRGADTMVSSALLQLPLHALRVYRSHFRSKGWRMLTSDAPPVLTLRVERTPAAAVAAGSAPLRLATPSAKELTMMLLSRCVACLQGLKLPSEAAEFAPLLTLHEDAQQVREQVLMEMKGAANAAAAADDDDDDDDDDDEGSNFRARQKAQAAQGALAARRGAAAAAAAAEIAAQSAKVASAEHEAAAEQAAQDAYMTFGKYDVDGSGSIDMTELKLALADLQMEVSDEELAGLMAAYGRGEATLDMGTFSTLVVALHKHREVAAKAAAEAQAAAAEAAARGVEVSEEAAAAADGSSMAAFLTELAESGRPGTANTTASDAASAAATSAAGGPRMRRRLGKKLPLPNRRSLRESLAHYYLDEATRGPPVQQVLGELEAQLATALKRAEATALKHPPFLAALDTTRRGELAQAPSLRTLDVGCIRVDGAELWPDEARELELEPFFAPLSLASMVLDFGGESAVVNEEASAPQQEESPENVLAGLLAFAAGVKMLKR